MKTHRPIPPRSLAVLIASAVLAGGSWIACVRSHPAPPPPDAGLLALAAERESLGPYTDSSREEWRRKRDELRERAWTRASLDTLAAGSDPRWRWTWPDTGRAEIERVDVGLDEWPACLAFVRSLERLPGATLAKLELRVAGLSQERRFSAIRLGLRFVLAGESAALSKAKKVTPITHLAPAGSPGAHARIPIETKTKEYPQ